VAVERPEIGLLKAFGYANTGRANSLVGRLVWLPIYEDEGKKLLHLGVAGRAQQTNADNAIRLRADGERVRTDLSCTVFLNDPDDYEGGELVAQDHETRHRIKLSAGHAVLYPGNTLHEVTPVTRGQRLACFFWVESMVRSDDQRRILSDLDMNLLKLREQHGETPETTALTGVYHNLLRQWANT
jgi:PKHD-type hydroxylase